MFKSRRYELPWRAGRVRSIVPWLDWGECSDGDYMIFYGLFCQQRDFLARWLPTYDGFQSNFGTRIRETWQLLAVKWLVLTVRVCNNYYARNVSLLIGSPEDPE